MSPNLEAYMTRLNEALGARIGRPRVLGGVLVMSRPLAMSADNLAALEAAWPVERPVEAARPLK